MQLFDSEKPFNELLVICNDGAGNGRTSELKETLARVWSGGRLRFKFAQKGDRESLSRLAKRSAVQARERRGALVAVGGDGTINAVAQAAWEAGVPLGIVPRGTFNYLARDLGIPLDIEAAATILTKPRVLDFRPGLVNDQVFMVNASVGLYRKLLEDREAFKQRFGRHRISAMLSGMLSLLGQRSQLRLVIEHGGHSRRVRTPSLFVANNRLQLEQIGLPLAGELGRDRLGAIVVRPVGTARLMGLALLGALGTLGEAEHLEAFPVSRLNVAGLGRHQIKVAMDGEVKRLQLPLTFRRPQHGLQVLVPSMGDAAPRR